MGDTFGDKFKKAFKLGGSSKDSGEDSPMASGAHGASPVAKVRRNPAGCRLVLRRFIRDARFDARVEYGSPHGRDDTHEHTLTVMPGSGRSNAEIQRLVLSETGN